MDNRDTQTPGKNPVSNGAAGTDQQLDPGQDRAPSGIAEAEGSKSNDGSSAPHASRKLDGPLLGMIGVGLACLGLVVFTAVTLIGGSSNRSDSRDPDAVVSPSLGFGQTPSTPSLPPANVDTDTVIAGTVIDASGAAVAGVFVTVQIEELADTNHGGLVVGSGAVETTTDDAGRFALANIDVGVVRIELTSDQIADAQVRFVTAPNLSLEIAVTRLVTIRGVVRGDALVERSGGPMAAQPTVVARLSGTVEPDSRIPLAADNGFALTGLSEGIYQVWLEGAELGSPAAIVSALGQGPFDNVALDAVQTPRVSGVVIDQQRGTPVTATISVASSTDQPDRIVVTDSAGRFSLLGILPGRWTASAAAPPFVTVEQLVFEGDRPRDLRLAVSRGGAIDGVVLDDAGTPVANAEIEVRRVANIANIANRQPIVAQTMRRDDPRFVPIGELGVLRGPIPYPPIFGAGISGGIRDRRVAQPLSIVPAADPTAPAELDNDRTTDSAGQFRIAGLGAGSYTLLARHADYAGSISKSITVRLGQTKEGVRLIVRRGITIEGSVTGSGGPIAFAQVASISKNQPALAVEADLNGDFSIGPLIGAVTLEASAKGFASARQTIPVGADGTVQQTNFTLEAANKKIAGRIIDSSGFPVRRARVTLKSDPANSSATNNNGRFVFENLRGGTHRLLLSHAQFPTKEVVATADGEEKEHRLTIGGGIVGRVRDAQTGTALSAATLEIRAKGHEPQLTNTDSDGRFRFSPIANGRWTITVRAPTYAVLAQEVDVRQGRQPGEVTVRGLQLDLSLGATVSGTVRDQNGERLAGAIVKIGNRQSSTDVDGNFKVVQIGSGSSVPVIASLPSVAGVQSVESTINLEAGDSKTGIELQIRIETD